ncbi:MAG: SUMF1/EgtB/PvdO family nonheme iron enzyme, partial [Deltaproteobacteria bacterium]|nr:SUMF1/EgtB/PvdO family nonheme iron enzyme [Deltaproteobacteria bacterium]
MDKILYIFKCYLMPSLLILLIISLFGCGEAEYSSTGCGNSDCGSISFQMIWEGAPAKEGGSAVPMALDCTGSEVSTVAFEVYDEDGALLKSNFFSCSQGHGTVDGISSGINRSLVVLGKDSREIVYFRAEVGGIEVVAGHDSAIGEVAMKSYYGTAGSIETPGEARDVFVVGSFGYVAGGDNGFTVIDINDPMAPAIAATIDTPGFAERIVVSGSYAYTADGSGGLLIIDIRNASSPYIVGSDSTDGYAYNVAVTGTYAYVTHGGPGLSIMNISDPSDPVMIGDYVNTGGDARAVALVSSFAYVADWVVGLQIINISDLSNPFIIKTYVTQGNPECIKVREGYAYLGLDATNAFTVIDISDTDNPILTGSINISGSPSDIVLSGSFAYVATSEALHVINIEDPENLTLFQSLIFPGAPLGIFVANSYIQVATTAGIHLVHIPDAHLEGDIKTSYTNSFDMTFNLIPAGTFTMGSPTGELGRYSDETEHEVTLTQSFYMQTTEVTQGQWQAVMGSNPSSFDSCGSDCPVEMVSWNDIQIFLSNLNAIGEGTYRLPTEAEWENTARAGSITALANGNISVTDCSYDENLDALGWYCYNSNSATHIVAQKIANDWGLYDMHGNVYEWCQDWYGAYPSTPVTDPTGSASGSERVIRGGS